MTDRPIIFSKPMVLALLEGRKTETRRLVKPSNSSPLTGVAFPPRFRAGDRLYVREDIQSWLAAGSKYVRYCADQKATFQYWPAAWKGDKAIAMHMFRHLSRMTLEVSDVRVERLHDITDAGAIAEGIERVSYEQAIKEFGGEPTTDSPYFGEYGWRDYTPESPHAIVPFHHEKAVLSYKSLWESINGKGSWDRNPWVVVISWPKVIHQNIDWLLTKGAKP